MSILDTRWEVVNFSFRFPKTYFYLHDNCNYCARFITVVPFLSIRP